MRFNLERALLVLSIGSLAMFSLMHHSFTGAYIDQYCFQEALYGINGADPQRLTDSDIVHIYLTDTFSSFNASHYDHKATETTSITYPHKEQQHHHSHMTGQRREEEDRGAGGEEEQGHIDVSTVPTLSYIYSPQRGFLVLPPSSRVKYNISSAVFYLPFDSADKCFHIPPFLFGDRMKTWMPYQVLKYLFGYDTIILNLMRRLSYDEGFLYIEHRRKFVDLSFYSRFVFSVTTMNSFGNPLLWDESLAEEDTGEVSLNASQIWANDCVAANGELTGSGQRDAAETGRRVGDDNGDGYSDRSDNSTCTLKQQQRHVMLTLRDKVFFKLSIVITATFLFFAMTSMVSFILKQTQSRMLKFTFLLQYHVRNQIPYSSLVFIHVFESLIFVPIMLGMCCCFESSSFSDC